MFSGMTSAPWSSGANVATYTHDSDGFDAVAGATYQASGFDFTDATAFDFSFYNDRNWRITGSDGDNDIDGWAGDDTILGLAGNDTIHGNGGDDVIETGTGFDYAWGGSGDDIFLVSDEIDYGFHYYDYFYGESGSDWLSFENTTVAWKINFGTALANGGGGLYHVFTSIENIVGSAQDDIVTADDGANQLYGLAGDDTLSGHGGNDTIDGGTGEDSLDGGAGEDWVLFTDNAKPFHLDLNDGLAIHYRQDTGAVAFTETVRNFEHATGGAFDDEIWGTGGDNTLNGGAGNDDLHGRDGDDLLIGGDGNDDIHGGDGNDTIKAGAGNDEIWGGNNDGATVFNDLIWGGEGNDTIHAGEGISTVYGGKGDDRIELGVDVPDEGGSFVSGPIYVVIERQLEATGGEGADTFVFTDTGEITITDFDDAEDTIEFHDIHGTKTVFAWPGILKRAIEDIDDLDSNGDGVISSADKDWYVVDNDTLMFSSIGLSRLFIEGVTYVDIDAFEVF